MDREVRDKILAHHQVDIPKTHTPNLKGHLQNPRDFAHYKWAVEARPVLALDVGAWDGWLAALLWPHGCRCDSVELIDSLADANERYAMSHAEGRHVYRGWFDEITIPIQYDTVFMFEVLEHVPASAVRSYIDKAESILCKGGKIRISLPDQDHTQNHQHQWTPSAALITSMWHDKDGFSVTYQGYPGTGIPGNWMVSWVKS